MAMKKAAGVQGQNSEVPEDAIERRNEEGCWRPDQEQLP